MEIANEYLAAGETDNALREVDNALTAYPENIQAFFFKAEILGIAGRYDEAFSALDSAKKNPGFSAEMEYLVEHWTGVVHYHKEELPKAAEHLEKSRKLNPSFVTNSVLLIQVYSKMNRPEEVLKYAAVWTDLEPDSGKAWASFGIHNVDAGKYEDAKRALDKAKELDPKSPLVYNYLGRWAEEQSMLGEAEEFYRESIGLNDNIAFVHLNLGQLYMRLDQPDKAYPVLKKSLELDPSLPYTHFWLARYHQGRKEYKKASDYLDSSIKLDPDFISGSIGYAELSSISGKNIDRAVAILEEGLEVSGENRKAFFYYLGVLHLARNELDKSMEYADKSFALLEKGENEGFADVHLLKGKILLKRKDRKSANAELRLAAKLAPGSETAKEARKLLK
jgi:tetratricopeptide (TPR) repeat protein